MRGMRVKGFPSLSILSLLCLPVLPSGLPAGEPQIIAIRPIQFEYPEFTQRTGGLTRVWWDATQGAFSEFQVLVDGNLEATVPGEELSADLGELPLGAHQVKVAGLLNSVEAASLETSFSILQSPPVQGVEALPCLFHSYQAATGGFLEILWNNRDTAETPYVDFDIIVNDVFQGVLEAPSRGLRFGRVFLGMYRVEVQAYTWNHICLPAEFVCQA